MSTARSLVVAVLMIPAIACAVGSGGAQDARDANDPKDAGENVGADAGSASQEYPWEVRSEQGETYLPNVFYAEPAQNEQVMPTALDGHDQILRLVYPTIGNPNLYVKQDPADSFMMVLRLEEDAVSHLAPTWDEPVAGSKLTRVHLTQTDASNRLAFYLVARGARVPNTEREDAIPFADGKNIIPIEPTEILASPVPDDMPDVFKDRRTLRAVFRQDAMKNVPPGLYDVRFEVLKDKQIYAGYYEHQFNAVEVFDAPPQNGEYQVINVTDTQVSVGSVYQGRTQTKLQDFVAYVNASTDPEIRNASFITFNGDLHNGGSPGGFRAPYVATTYNEEAKVIVNALKELNFPIFLTAGNHDGYVATGWVPGAVEVLDALTLASLQDTVENAGKNAWPNFSWNRYEAYLNATSILPGGWHRDVFTGQFTRREGGTFDAWIPVPQEDRNMVLYDGFYQWQRTYGPLYASFRFGSSFYVNMNSFELRQHRRTGWGMYTVNYGGGMSPVQLAWVKRELDFAQSAGLDTTLIAHQDPRGGHKGTDFGYYFQQLDYKGIGQSTLAYVDSEVVLKQLCKLPDWAKGYIGIEEDCLHDGLLEWMRPDEEFDCEDADRLEDGTCDPSKLDPTLPVDQQHHLRSSAYELIDAITTHPNVRTLILGHTHYDALDMLQAGDEMIPGNLELTSDDVNRLAALEVQNPVRGFAWLWKGASDDVSASDYDPSALAEAGIVAQNGRFFRSVEQSARPFQRVIQGSNREVAILHITCNADITSQTYNGRTNLGFSVLHVTHKNDARAYDLPQINRVAYFVNAGEQVFDDVKVVSLDRTTRIGEHDADNPLVMAGFRFK